MELSSLFGSQILCIVLILQTPKNDAASNAFAWQLQHSGNPVPNIVTAMTEHFLAQVIFDGSVTFDSESQDHRQLLNRGIATVEKSQDEGGQQLHRLIIAAPLLASAALRKHREPLPSSNVETLTTGQAKDA